MDQSDEMIAIYTTFPSEECAQKTGALLVETRIAACVNIFPGMASIYRWQDNVEEAKEVAMIVKTRKSLQAEAFNLIASNHPYTVPALLVFQPQQVEAAYDAWLQEATKRKIVST